MTKFSELIQTRRSIRRYKSQQIEDEKIQLILQSALMSPASKRSNPWEFIVVQHPEMLIKLSECRSHSAEFLARAPLCIVVIADRTKTDIWQEDASIASIVMQLQAHDLGLGSCWIQVFGRMKNEQLSSENYIRSLLQIPEKYAIHNLLSIGYSDEQKTPFDASKLAAQKIHYDKF
jgi:nitroreductase